MHVMAATNDLVAGPSLPLDVVVHNATVILSGVLLGAMLAFVPLRLGWLRHHIHLNGRLADLIFPLGSPLFFFTLPLWCIVTYPYAFRFSEFVYEHIALAFHFLMSCLPSTSNPSVRETIEATVQMATKTPSG